MKEIIKYNKLLVYSFENLKKTYTFKRYFKENNDFVKKETVYKIENTVDLNFHKLKIQNIKIKNDVRNSSENPYSENGSFIVDKNNNILLYFDKIWDYKVYNNKLMIISGGEWVLNVTYIYYKKDKPFYGIDLNLPKWVSGHTGIGIVINAKILSENYIICDDIQKVTEMYRVINTKSDYEKNAKKAKLLKFKKIDTKPETMKLISYEGEKCFQFGKNYDHRAHDFIFSKNNDHLSSVIKKFLKNK